MAVDSSPKPSHQPPRSCQRECTFWGWVRFKRLGAPSLVQHSSTHTRRHACEAAERALHPPRRAVKSGCASATEQESGRRSAPTGASAWNFSSRLGARPLANATDGVRVEPQPNDFSSMPRIREVRRTTRKRGYIYIRMRAGSVHRDGAAG